MDKPGLIIMENSPATTALYRHYDAANTLLYVGISLNAIDRLRAHVFGSHWSSEISQVKVEYFPSRQAALAAEKSAIRDEHPRWNIAHNKPRKLAIGKQTSINNRQGKRRPAWSSNDIQKALEALNQAASIVADITKYAAELSVEIHGCPVDFLTIRGILTQESFNKILSIFPTPAICCAQYGGIHVISGISWKENDDGNFRFRCSATSPAEIERFLEQYTKLQPEHNNQAMASIIPALAGYSDTLDQVISTTKRRKNNKNR